MLKLFLLLFSLNVVTFALFGEDDSTTVRISDSPILFEAILDGNKSFIQQLIDCQWVEADSKTAFGLSSLMQAATQGDNTLVKLFLSYGTDIDAQSPKSGWTPLMFASNNGWLETVKLLVDRGANISIKDIDGNTATALAANAVIFHYLENTFSYTSKYIDLVAVSKPMFPDEAEDSKRRYGKVDMVYMKQETTTVVYKTPDKVIQSDTTYPLFAAIVKGSLALVRTLIKAGARVNVQDNRGITALMLASHYGFVQIAQHLIKVDADLNLRSIDGWTALMFATSQGHYEVVQLLTENWANLNVKSEIGITALHLSSIDNVDITKYLIAKNAQVNVADINGATPLFFAADNSQVFIVKLLSEANANISPQKSDGSTPLHFAVQRGDLNIVNVLLELGADVDARTNDDSTALMYACYRGDWAIVQLLLETFVADITARNRWGMSAIDFASDKSFLKHFLLKKIKTSKNSSGWMYACHNFAIAILSLYHFMRFILTDNMFILPN